MFFSKAFFPLFSVQFLGAFNDNLFKSAMVMLIAFKLADSPEQAGLLTTLAAGIFILPFFLLSAFAGNLTDQIEKTKLIRRVKLAEVLIMLFGAWAVLASSLVGLFVLLFLMGAQSAFFGPIKYAILPEHIEPQALSKGNGWFSASTFIAILLGTLVGGWVVLAESGAQMLAGLVVAMAVLGWLMSWAMPNSSPRLSPEKIHFRPLFLTKQEVLAGLKYPQAFLAVLAISWFWFLGAGYLSQIPVLVKNTLFGNEQVVLLFLTTFSVGIGLGAFLVNKLIPRFKDLSALKYHGVMLASLSVLMVLSNLFVYAIAEADNLRNIITFVTDIPSLMVLVCLLLISTIGGAYIVPLYTHLQVHSPEYFRGRMIAVNNIVNSLLMVLSSLLFLLGYGLEFNLLGMFYLLAFMNVVVAIALHKRIVFLRESIV